MMPTRKVKFREALPDFLAQAHQGTTYASEDGGQAGDTGERIIELPECAMNMRRFLLVVLVLGAASSATPEECRAQCCLEGLFRSCQKAPAYAVAPMMAPPAVVPAPMMAPMMAPVAAPPPPVMVPVQQVSYVPETTYRTQYKCVPVTSYKPTSEVDPCTGCTRECMAPVTQYVQQAVNVPVTQYRAVYSTKYVQMQPGTSAPAGYGAPTMMQPAAATAPSPFAATVQTTPQAWGAAGADVPQQLIQPNQQSIAAPVLQPGVMPQQGFQQPIVPQSGTYAVPMPTAVGPQPTAPPMLQPTPSLKPIPELQRLPVTSGGNGTGTTGSAQVPVGQTPGLVPSTQPYGTGTTPNGAAPALPSQHGGTGAVGMPVLPGAGPSAATNAFPRLLEPTGHTTAWQPNATLPAAVGRPTAYPTAVLPGRVQ